MIGCDACGRPGRWALWATVPDSSCPDGRRTLTTCSPQHLAQLQRIYARRPWAVEEMWLARIRLTRHGADHPLTPAQLAVATGLDRVQVDRAFDWYRARLTHRLRQMAALVATNRGVHRRRGPAVHRAGCRLTRRRGSPSSNL